jgi:hypothetical protein
MKKSIVFLLAGICYTIILKICIIIFPDIFTSIYISQTGNIFSVLVGLSFILFGLYFIKEVVGKNHLKLKVSVYLAISGPLFLMLLHLSNIIRLSDKLSLKLYYLSPFLHDLVIANNFKSLHQIVIFLSALFILNFLYVLYKNLSTENKNLKGRNFLMLIGFALTAALRSFSSVIYFLFPDSPLMYDPPKILYLIGFLIFLFTSLVSISFFLKLYRVMDYSKIIRT